MIEEIEKIMNDQISFKDYLLPPDFTVERFVRNFKENGRRYYTINTAGEILTSIGKYRSLNDIYCITKHYFPDVTLKKVMQILVEQVQAGDNGVLFCDTIQKRVFGVSSSLNAGFAENPKKLYGRYTGTELGKDEHGFDETTYLNLLKEEL